MSELYPILAVETSGELCSVALLLGEKNSVELNFIQKHIHSQKLIGMIDALFQTSVTELSDVKSIAVSMGPGSFTGLRIGLSAAKGIAFGNNLPIIPVPTFDAYAFHVGEYLCDGTKFSIVVSANLEEYYFSRYVKKTNGIDIVDQLKLIMKNELKNIIESGEIIYGNVTGLEKIKPVIRPTAKSVGEWAYFYGKDLLTFDYDYLEPNYFKKFIVKVRR